MAECGSLAARQSQAFLVEMRAGVLLHEALHNPRSDVVPVRSWKAMHNARRVLPLLLSLCLGLAACSDRPDLPAHTQAALAAKPLTLAGCQRGACDINNHRARGAVYRTIRERHGQISVQGQRRP